MAQPAQTRRRPAGAAVLAIPLLAVLVLAGVGTAASLRDGFRAERVRGLAPFNGALTTLVQQLQRERSLSMAGDTGDDAALEVARRAVDGAAAAYRDAAVRVDISDRDRRLHQRLDAGLTELAGLGALRASVDGLAATADPEVARAGVFRRYTAVVGGLLAVGAEIGLQEAGQDAGLQRAVGAASMFSRALELADRERAAAARAAAGSSLDQAERARLAALGGRQDAFLDQFRALASPGQLQAYGRSLPAAEAERAARLRRAALEGDPGADLAGWSQAATTRVDQMRKVERRLTAEVTRLAVLAERTADRRALAYGGVFLLTACAMVVLLVLAPGRARRAPTRGTRKPHAAPFPGLPNTEGSPAAPAPAQAVHIPLHGEPGAEPGPGLADLARRSQDLADQQLELLDQAGRDQGDPRLPGRLLQLDRLAVRSRRNAHNLIVLAGGEPSRRWDGLAPLAEVAAAAVLDNPDAPRVGHEQPVAHVDPDPGSVGGDEAHG